MSDVLHYVVQPGDYFLAIARKLSPAGATNGQLATFAYHIGVMNGLKPDSAIYVGQVLHIVPEYIPVVDAPTGPTGSTGPTGAPTGPSGPTGAPTGPSGSTGPTGAPTGPTGTPTGPTGSTGPVAKTLFGACPDAGSSPAGVVAKYGNGVAIRWFDSGDGISKVPVRPSKAQCSLFHASWKVLGQTLTDANVTNACKNLLPGDKVTVEHEFDVKHKKDGSAADLAARMAQVKKFHEIVKRVRPDLVTVSVLAGWRFHPNGDDWAPYVGVADVLGVDLDGANDRKAYVDWTACLPEIKKMANLHYNGRWTCPEYGWPRLDTAPESTTGEKRLAEIKREMPTLLAAKPEEIIWFDYPTTPTYPFTTAAEISYWKSLVAQNV